MYALQLTFHVEMGRLLNMVLRYCDLTLHTQNPAHKHAVVADRISDHIFECQALLDDIKYGETIRPCEDIICCYFRWFYPRHYNQCNYACFQNGKQGSIIPLSSNYGPSLILLLQIIYCPILKLLILITPRHAF